MREMKGIEILFRPLYTIPRIGILAGLWPCGVVVFVAELFVSESKAQVYGILHNLCQTYPESTKDIRKLWIHKSLFGPCNYLMPVSDAHYRNAGYVCYDDACHLRKYATNPLRRDCTPYTKFIANSEIVVDRMHFAGHKDAWCRKNCNPNDHRDLDKVWFRHAYRSLCTEPITWLCNLIFCVYTTCMIMYVGGHWSLWTDFCLAFTVCKDHKGDESTALHVLPTLHLWPTQS